MKLAEEEVSHELVPSNSIPAASSTLRVLPQWVHDFMHPLRDEASLGALLFEASKDQDRCFGGPLK
jgi:hypothetical protein